MLQSASRGGGGLVPGGFSLAGGVWYWGEFSLAGEGLVPGGGSPWQTPPVNRMTDRCKNITLATTSLRPVTKRLCFSRKSCYNLINPKYLLPGNIMGDSFKYFGVDSHTIYSHCHSRSRRFTTVQTSVFSHCPRPRLSELGSLIMHGNVFTAPTKRLMQISIGLGLGVRQCEWTIHAYSYHYTRIIPMEGKIPTSREWGGRAQWPLKAVQPSGRKPLDVVNSALHKCLPPSIVT